MPTSTQSNGLRRSPLRTPLRVAGVAAIALGLVLGASGCGYDQMWQSANQTGTTNGTTLNWQYPTPQTAP